jgi:hypothetical protein
MSTIAAERRCSDTGIVEFPFRHRVIDDWAEPELVRAAEAEWPRNDWPFWHRYDSGKLATKDPLRFPLACAELIRRMLCLPIHDWMGIDDSFGDWNCHGAGLHAAPPGARLGVHLDSDHHPQTGWQRVCNAILFVNSFWPARWGGELELWNSDGTECVKRIAPRFNRLVLFEPSDLSFHAVAENRGPEVRKTLATFYWRESLEPGVRPRAQFC